MRNRSLLFLLILCVALAFACKRDETAAVSTDTTTTETNATVATMGTGDDPTHPASPGGTAVVPDATGGTTVEVMLGDGTLAVPATAVPPGPAVINVTNSGKETHNLTVEGPGVAVAGEPLPPGNSRPVDATFQAGTYTFYCTILDHRTKGEQATLTIVK